MSDEHSLSPGKLVVIWRLILLVSQNEGIAISDVIDLLSSQGILGGIPPAKEAVHLCQIYQLITIEKEKIYLTDGCRDSLMPLCSEKDPNYRVIRAILFLVVSQSHFHWLIFFNADMEIFKVAIPQIWIDLLDSGGLFNINDQNVSEWWENLLSTLQKYNQDILKKIGDLGESLTFDFEKKRLARDGRKRVYSLVKWVSRFSDKFGYDILSKRGKLLKEKYSDMDEIRIEVKASTSPDVTYFRFKISRNEYEIAIKCLKEYYLYCWTNIDLSQRNDPRGPFVVPIKEIIQSFPKDSENFCEWTECRFELDLRKYNPLNFEQ